MMRDYVKILYNYVYTRVPDSGDIEDIIQETMLAAWKSIGTYNASSSFKTWLIGIANNKINDYYRHRYRNRTETLEGQGEITDGYDFTEHTAVKNDVKQALSVLDDDEKHLVHLIFNVRLSYSEISEITGIPTGTIKSRMSAIKEKLKKRLGEGYYG
ncbi:MAG: sigma-70 family RNA polymerase sigma factor [Eubacteriales bacterium]|nr:sigma-70 family RNA polymerase sigma factor [Eubacteriales bacterium]